MIAFVVFLFFFYNTAKMSYFNISKEQLNLKIQIKIK